MLASTFTHDRGVAGSRQDLLHVLPVAGSDKMWYLNAARAGLLHGVWEPPQRVQPRHDRTARLARTGPQRHHFHPSWWPRVAWGTATQTGWRQQVDPVYRGRLGHEGSRLNGWAEGVKRMAFCLPPVAALCRAAGTVSRGCGGPLHIHHSLACPGHL